MELCQIVELKDDVINSKGKKYDCKNLRFLLNGEPKKVLVFTDHPLYEEISKLHAGQEVEFDVSENDKKYLSIKSIGEIKEPISAPVATAPLISRLVETSSVPEKKPWSPAKFSPEERASIERQTAVKAAVELIASIKFKTFEEAYAATIQTAEGFYEYISPTKVQSSEDSQ